MSQPPDAPIITQLRQPTAEMVSDEDEEPAGYKLAAMRVFSEIATSLSSDADLELLLARFLQTLIRVAGANAGAVRVLTSSGTHMRLVSAIGLPAAVVEREHLVPADCGVCGCAAREAVVQTRAAGPGCREMSGLDYFGGACRQVLAVPLRHKGKVMGVYNLFMPHDRPIPEDVSLLFLSISEHLGMALENARLTRENLRITLMNERQMLANEIHDSLAQTLAYMKMRLAMLRDAVRSRDDAQTERYLGEVDDAMEMAYSGLRELLHQFRQKMDPRGLLPALDELTAAFCKRTGVRVEFDNQVLDLNLSPDQEVHIYHIVQEALANIAKHAHARHVRLRLSLEGERYVLTIADDGIGLNAQQGGAGMHLGMNIMRERAERLGGCVSVESHMGEGTRVVLEFPAQPARTLTSA